MSGFTDEDLAMYATSAWVDKVGSVAPNELAAMVAEDPSIVTALVGALRFERARHDECKALRDRMLPIAVAALMLRITPEVAIRTNGAAEVEHPSWATSYTALVRAIDAAMDAVDGYDLLMAAAVRRLRDTK